jgi:hygromycin-B 7''-O-kinase
MDIKPQEYSKRLGIIPGEQLQRALDKFNLGALIHAESIGFGLFGQNLFLTSTKGDFVLRGAPHYDWQFPTERFFVEQLYQKTRVPVPFPYLFEPSTDIFGWGFVIMPRMPGLQTADEQTRTSLTQEDNRGIARAMARTLAEAQNLTWDFAGKYDPATNAVQPLPIGYRVWLVQRIRELLAAARSHTHHTTNSDVQWMEELIDRISRASFALQVPFTPCIVMEDYKEANAVVELTAHGWRVSGVFDLMTAHFGDGEADLSRQVGHYLRENPTLADEFVQQYLQIRPAQTGFAERQRLYMLYDSLLIWEFWQRHAGGLPEDKSLTLEEWARPFVDFWARFD